MKSLKGLSALMLVGALVAGCATSYSWSPRVPGNMRTVAVPTFRSEADVTELGSQMTRQVLREFQREGTFKIASSDEAAVEIQGVVKSASLGLLAYSRRLQSRVSAHEFTAEVEISVIDKKNGRVLVDNRVYKAQTTLSAGQDYDTAKRDASGRLADDLARQVVDDVLNLKW